MLGGVARIALRRWAFFRLGMKHETIVAMKVFVGVVMVVGVGCTGLK